MIAFNLHPCRRANVFTLGVANDRCRRESGQVEQRLPTREFYEREVDYDLKLSDKKSSRFLIVIMAVFVTILALGIFLPMWIWHEILQKVRSNSLLKYYIARSGEEKFGEKTEFTRSK